MKCTRLNIDDLNSVDCARCGQEGCDERIGGGGPYSDGVGMAAANTEWGTKTAPAKESMLDQLNVRRVVNALGKEMTQIVEGHRFELIDEDTASSMRRLLCDYLSTFVGVRAIEDFGVCAGVTTRDWDHHYPTYGRKWLALVTELLEYYGITRGFAGCYKRSDGESASRFRWYHYLLPYKRVTYAFVPTDAFVESLPEYLREVTKIIPIEWVEENTYVFEAAMLQRPDKVIDIDTRISPVGHPDLKISMTVVQGGIPRPMVKVEKDAFCGEAKDAGTD